MRMSNKGNQNRMGGKAGTARKWVLLLCACVVWTSGCFTRRTPAKPYINVIGFAHPVIPPATVEAALEPPPDIPIEGPAAPPQLVTGRSAPTRPRVAPAPAATATEKTARPTIAPEVTTEEMTAARAETEHNLGLAEKNLALVGGKQLNATQQDVISKVRSFADNAREAMRSSDWERAKSLSKKAEVLSEQLAASL
jgi:hypothetical protein